MGSRFRSFQAKPSCFEPMRWFLAELGGAAGCKVLRCQMKLRVAVLKTCKGSRRNEATESSFQVRCWQPPYHSFHRFFADTKLRKMPPDTAARCCPTLPDAARCCPKLPEAARCYPNAASSPNHMPESWMPVRAASARHCPKLPEAARSCPKPPDAARCCPMPPESTGTPARKHSVGCPMLPPFRPTPPDTDTARRLSWWVPAISG